MSESNTILTKGQQEYLKGNKEPSQERTTLTRIRKRLRSGLSELSLVADSLPVEEFEKSVKDDVVDPWTRDLVTVAYLISAYDGAEQGASSQIDRFEDLVSAGVKQALNRMGIIVEEIDVSIEVTEQKAEKELGDMTLDEIEQLARAGELNREEVLPRLVDLMPEYEGDRPDHFPDFRESRAEMWADLFGLDPESEDE